MLEITLAMFVPRWPHYCYSCKRVKQTERADWYICNGSLLGRYGPEVSDYWSADVGIIQSLASTYIGSGFMQEAIEIVGTLDKPQLSRTEVIIRTKD